MNGEIPASSSGLILSFCCRPGKPRAGKPARRPGHRQPIGQDDRERRAAGLRFRQEDQRAEAPCRDRHRRPAGRCRGPSRRHPGSRRRWAGHRGRPQPVPMAAPSLCRQRLCWRQAAQQARRIRPLDNRARQTPGCGRRVSTAAAPLGGRTDLGLAQSQPPSSKGTSRPHSPVLPPGFTLLLCNSSSGGLHRYNHYDSESDTQPPFDPMLLFQLRKSREEGYFSVSTSAAAILARPNRRIFPSSHVPHSVVF